MNQNKKYSSAVCIGRWQLPSLQGHGALFQRAFELADTVVIIIGSAFKARDPRNPFTWCERKQMISAMLTAEQMSRVRFEPVRDYYDDAKWNAAVLDVVGKHAGRADSVCLVGYKKDDTSYYLDSFRGWKAEQVTPACDIDATTLRNVLFEARDLDAALAVLGQYVHSGVLAYLDAWSKLPVFQTRRMEHLAVKKYRTEWTAPMYNTADAVVVSSAHVLLIRRGGEIGKGLLALPGGFIEPNERFLSAAIRELREETHIGLLESSLRGSLRDTKLFDHPLRSARGRLVTHAYFFELGDMGLAEVQGSDDADAAIWVPLSHLAALEEQLFEDHFSILRAFLEDAF